MSHHHRSTVQPRLGTLYRPCDGADAGGMKADRVNPLAAKDTSITAGAQTLASGGYAEPDGITAATNATVSAAAGAGLLSHSRRGTGDNPPNGQVRKARPQGTLSGSISRVPAGTLWVMRSHTQEQPAHAPDSETYRYLLSHNGPLLPQPSAPDGANPWPGRPKP